VRDYDGQIFLLLLYYYYLLVVRRRMMSFLVEDVVDVGVDVGVV
jgi:hypothetical protein